MFKDHEHLIIKEESKNGIFIDKKALEDKRDNFKMIARTWLKIGDLNNYHRYRGKIAVINDILKLFNKEDKV